MSDNEGELAAYATSIAGAILTERFRGDTAGMKESDKTEAEPRPKDFQASTGYSPTFCYTSQFYRKSPLAPTVFEAGLDRNCLF